MSQEKLEQARNRLARARQDILQDLYDLNEPAADWETYKLSYEEADQLYQEFSAEIIELQSTLAQVLTIRTTISSEVDLPEAEPKDYGGPIPPWGWPPDEEQRRRVRKGFPSFSSGAMPPQLSPYRDESAWMESGPSDLLSGPIPPGGPPDED